MKIVDASVAVKWFADEAGVDETLSILSEDLVAPSLIPGEVANTLWTKCRRGEVSRDQSLVAIANLPDLLVELYPVAREQQITHCACVGFWRFEVFGFARLIGKAV